MINRKKYFRLPSCQKSFSSSEGESIKQIDQQKYELITPRNGINQQNRSSDSYEFKTNYQQQNNESNSSSSGSSQKIDRWKSFLMMRQEKNQQNYNKYITPISKQNNLSNYNYQYSTSQKIQTNSSSEFREENALSEQENQFQARNINNYTPKILFNQSQIPNSYDLIRENQINSINYSQIEIDNNKDSIFDSNKDDDQIFNQIHLDKGNTQEGIYFGNNFLTQQKSRQMIKLDNNHLNNFDAKQIRFKQDLIPNIRSNNDYLSCNQDYEKFDEDTNSFLELNLENRLSCDNQINTQTKQKIFTQDSFLDGKQDGQDQNVFKQSFDNYHNDQVLLLQKSSYKNSLDSNKRNSIKSDQNSSPFQNLSQQKINFYIDSIKSQYQGKKLFSSQKKCGSLKSKDQILQEQLLSNEITTKEQQINNSSELTLKFNEDSKKNNKHTKLKDQFMSEQVNNQNFKQLELNRPYGFTDIISRLMKKNSDLDKLNEEFETKYPIEQVKIQQLPFVITEENEEYENEEEEEDDDEDDMEGQKCLFEQNICNNAYEQLEDQSDFCQIEIQNNKLSQQQNTQQNQELIEDNCLINQINFQNFSQNNNLINSVSKKQINNFSNQQQNSFLQSKQSSVQSIDRNYKTNFNSLKVLSKKAKKNKNQLSLSKQNLLSAERQIKNYDMIYRQHIVSIIENHANQVGFAAYNVQTGHISISQIVDRLSYLNTISTINTFYPLEIIYSNTQTNSYLIKTLQQQLHSTKFTPVKRNLFDETKGEAIFKKRNQNAAFKFDSLYVSLASLNALEVSQDLFLLKEQLKIEFIQMDSVLVMDPKTALDLELLIQQQTQSEDGSIISLFRCSTIGGKRLLRSNFLQPINDLKVLKQRQNAVLEFTLQKDCIINLQNILKDYKELETCAVKFIQKVKELDFNRIRQLIIHIYKLYCILKKFSQLQMQLKLLNLQNEIVADLQQVLSEQQIEQIKESIRSHLDIEFIEKVSTQSLNKLSDMVKLNLKILSCKLNYQLQNKVFFILKSENNDLIEIERTKLLSIQQMAQNIYDEYRNKLTGYACLELKENDIRGYYLIAKEIKESNRKISQTEIEDIIEERLLEVEEKRINKKNQIIFITQIFGELSNRIKETKYSLLLYTSKSLKEIIPIIQNSLQILFKINSLISQIDICLSFSEFYYSFSSEETPLCMPKLIGSENNISILQDFYHPLLIFNNIRQWKVINKIQSNQLDPYGGDSIFIQKNDIFISNLNNLQLLIGYDNSGKSLIIKSIAIIQIMAQIGCYVPAKNSILSLKNLILSKFYSTDSIEEKQSSFTSEIQQLDFILKSKISKQKNTQPSNQSQIQTLKKDSSIILIDELCSSSSFEDNISIGFTFLEEILISFPYSFIVCASKFQEYIEMGQPYHNIHSYHISEDYQLKEIHEGNQMESEIGITSEGEQLKITNLNSFISNKLMKHLINNNQTIDQANKMSAFQSKSIHFANKMLSKELINGLLSHYQQQQ